MTQPLPFRLAPCSNILVIATIVRGHGHPLPFASPDENDSYAHLASLCVEKGLVLYVSHFDNLMSEADPDGRAPRATLSSWVHRDGAWQAVRLALKDVALAYADLPQNLPAAESLRRSLVEHGIPVVNPLPLSDLLTDKLATYDILPDLVPATWIADTPGLVELLRRHPLHTDLSARLVFLKPRFGERGRNIYVTGLEDLETHPARRSPGFIVQSFLETGCGIPELGIDGRHDLRLILCNGELVLSFIRLPADGSYVSNCSKGGREIPIEIDRLPDAVKRFAGLVDARLRDFGPRLYSLDLGVGQSGKLWIYELNTMPGIVWDGELPENKHLHVAMHRIVADWLSRSCICFRVGNRHHLEKKSAS